MGDGLEDVGQLESGEEKVVILSGEFTGFACDEFLLWRQSGRENNGEGG